METLRVLLVDDAISFHSMIEMFLRQSKTPAYILQSVVSAEDMFRVLKSEPTDVVLLDISLPGLNGLKACETIHTQYPHLPIIIITAKLDRTLNRQALDVGASDFLLKPFDGNALRMRIQNAIRQKALVG